MQFSLFCRFSAPPVRHWPKRRWARFQAVDPATRTLTLEDGNSFVLGDAVAIDSLQPGSDVTVSYEEKDGQKTATEVKPAQ